jgi:hypothetical protein
VVFTILSPPGSWSQSYPAGLPAGSYSVRAADFQGVTACVNFEIGSVGGQMLPINMVAVLAPWIALVVVVTVGLVGVGVFARRLVTQHD